MIIESPYNLLGKFNPNVCNMLRYKPNNLLNILMHNALYSHTHTYIATHYQLTDDKRCMYSVTFGMCTHQWLN